MDLNILLFPFSSTIICLLTSNVYEQKKGTHKVLTWIFDWIGIFANHFVAYQFIFEVHFITIIIISAFCTKKLPFYYQLLTLLQPIYGFVVIIYNNAISQQVERLCFVSIELNKILERYNAKCKSRHMKIKHKYLNADYKYLVLRTRLFSAHFYLISNT